MSKVLGAIFFVLGTLISLFVLFLYLNSSASLNYNSEPMGLLETGLILPGMLGGALFIVGLIFIFASKEDSFTEL